MNKIDKDLLDILVCPVTKDKLLLDEKNNELLTEFAEYDKELELFKTVGETIIFTSEASILLVFAIKRSDLISYCP